MHKNSNPYITIYYIISIIFKSQTSNITSFHQSILIIIYILSQNVSNIYYYDRVKIVHIYYYAATRSSWHGSASCCRRDGDVFLEALVCQLSFFFSLIHQKNPKIKIYNLLLVAINSIPYKLKDLDEHYRLHSLKKNWMGFHFNLFYVNGFTFN